MGISSPLSSRVDRWRGALAEHPDREFVGYLLNGLELGFRVGFRQGSPLSSATRNMHSASLHPSVVDDYLGAEAQEGRMLGPFPPGKIDGLHINRMGVVPKGRTPGRWRLITDLSYPDGGSVNNGIRSDLCALRYISVELVARVAQSLGKGSLLAKLDIKSAYRLIPVHPMDRALLGIEWRGAHYVDGALPFGLRSAPKIFTALADALQWVMLREGVSMVHHYLDDFITIGPPSSNVCKANLDRILAVCRDLGVPLAMEKLEGPSQCLVFLGIEIDTVRCQLRLPAEKLIRLQALLDEWSSRKSCQRRQLESLVGTLQHACQVIRPGRTFLRRIIDLLRIPGATQGHHHIRLNREFRADLQWWITFAEHWNGAAIFPCLREPSASVTSDASGSWGCGAWSGSKWFQLQWPTSLRDYHISFKELFAGLVAFTIWGKGWYRCRVRWWCDNQAAVHAVNKRSCRDRDMMRLVRCLFFLEARFGFELVAAHLPGRENMLADDLSRNKLSDFLSKAQSPDRLPSEIPAGLRDLLLDREGWTSQRWTRRFNDFVTAALLNQPGEHTSPV